MADILAIESALVDALKQVYDPEIPVSIYELGLIYDVEVEDTGFVRLTMTLTAPNCPLADELIDEVRNAVEGVDGVTGSEIELVFDPPWTQDRMSEEAKLELGYL